MGFFFLSFSFRLMFNESTSNYPFKFHDSVCDKFRYGQNCSEECGHCKDNKTCNPIDGVCNNSCSPGFTGEMCKKGIYAVFSIISFINMIVSCL